MTSYDPQHQGVRALRGCCHPMCWQKRQRDCARHTAEMSQRHRDLDVERLCERAGITVQSQPSLLASLDDFNLEGLETVQSERLGHRFFGTKPGSQVLERRRLRPAILQLSGCEELNVQAWSPLKSVTKAVGLDQIDADLRRMHMDFLLLGLDSPVEFPNRALTIVGYSHDNVVEANTRRYITSQRWRSERRSGGVPPTSKAWS